MQRRRGMAARIDARTRRAATVSALALLALAACNAIAGLDDEYTLAVDVEAGGPDVIADTDSSQQDAFADDAGVDARKTCPSGRGPEMVVIDETYCIDSTEVTQEQYAAFLAADAGFAFLPESGVCAWKTSFVPAKPLALCRWDPSTNPNLPVVCVDWCDAYAYCAWAGKRLCGAIDGGPIPWDGDADTDPNRDEWYRACSKAGTRKFPYGDAYDAGACLDSKANQQGVGDAGSRPGCVGGYEGVWDMVGSAFEFEDSCSGNDGGDDLCKVRGGSWAHPETTYSSCIGVGRGDRRDLRTDDFGIRCCAAYE